MEREREREGFTIAELLVVVAIIGILVAVSIPIFSAQIKKAKIATNKANIRAAKAAALSLFYDDLAAGKMEEVKFSDTTSAYAYYKYDVATGTIEVAKYEQAWMRTLSLYSGHFGQYTELSLSNENQWKAYTTAYSAFEQAKNGEVCDTIYVFVCENPGDWETNIRTCPYYLDDDTLGAQTGGKSDSHFGPITSDYK